MYRRSISALLALGLLGQSGAGHAIRILGKNLTFKSSINIDHHNRVRGNLPPEKHENINWGHGEKGFEAPQNNNNSTNNTGTNNTSKLPVIDDGLSYSKLNIPIKNSKKVGRDDFYRTNKQGGLDVNLVNLMDPAMLYEYSQQSDWKRQSLSTVTLPMGNKTLVGTIRKSQKNKFFGHELFIWGVTSQAAIDANPERVSVIPLASKKNEKDKHLASEQYLRREAVKLFVQATFKKSPGSFLTGFDPDTSAKDIEVTFHQHDKPLRDLPNQLELPMSGLLGHSN